MDIKYIQSISDLLRDSKYQVLDSKSQNTTHKMHISTQFCIAEELLKRTVSPFNQSLIYSENPNTGDE